MSRLYMRSQQSSLYTQNPTLHQPGRPQAPEQYQPTLQPCDESHYVDNSQINWHQSRTRTQPYYEAGGHNAQQRYATAQDFGHQEPEVSTQPAVFDKESQRRQRHNDYMECESVGNDSACCPTSCASGSVCYEENCPKQIPKETVIPCTRDPCDEPGRISREGQHCLTKGIDVLKQVDWNRQAISDTRTAEWESTSWNPQFATQTFNMDSFHGNGIEALVSMASMDMSSQQEHNHYMPGSPDAVTPSMGYECHTPYSTGPMSTPSFHHSTQPFQNESQSIAKGTGDMLDGAGQWQNMDCEWDQCHEPFSDPNQFQTHLHEKHLDPLIKWKCAMPSSDCGDIVADPVEHLRTVHTWTQSNCPGGCPPPLDIDPAYLHIHFDQEHSFLLQEGLPCKWASCDTRVENFNCLSAHLNSQHGVNLPDLTDGDINLTSVHSSIPGHHSAQHELQPSATNDNTGCNLSTASNLSLVPEPSIVSTHGVCQWQMEDGRICGVVTTGQDQVAAKAMQKHVEEAHLTQLNSKKGYICQWKDCNRSAKMPPNKVAFTQRGKLGRHIHSHTGYKSEECPICHKQFSADQALKTHMNQHTKEKPWKCKHLGCSEEFASQSACTVHERIHTGEKPLKCPFCDMSFSDSSNLSKHRKTHVGEEGSYRCSFPGCTRLLTSRSHLQRHTDAMHGNKTGNDGVAKGRHNSRKVAVRGKKIKPESFDDDTSTSLASEADDKISVF